MIYKHLIEDDPMDRKPCQLFSMLISVTTQFDAELKQTHPCFCWKQLHITAHPSCRDVEPSVAPFAVFWNARSVVDSSPRIQKADLLKNSAMHSPEHLLGLEGMQFQGATILLLPCLECCPGESQWHDGRKAKSMQKLQTRLFKLNHEIPSSGALTNGTFCEMR